MSIERMTETTAILPGEWVIPIALDEKRTALPPRQVRSITPHGNLLFTDDGYGDRKDIALVCDTETEAVEAYQIILTHREKRQKAIKEINTRVDLEMQSALDMIIHTANYKE